MKRLLMLLAPLILVGCAGMDVYHFKQNPNVALPPPEAFYVQDFSIDRAHKDESADSGWPRTEYLGRLHDYSQLMADRIRLELGDIAPVAVYKTTDPLPRKGYIIKGDFLRIEEGSEAAREYIGWGAGQTITTARVRVFLVEPIGGKNDLDAGANVAYTGGTSAVRVKEPDQYDGPVRVTKVMEFYLAGGSKANGIIALEHSNRDDVIAGARKAAWKIKEGLGYPKN